MGCVRDARSDGVRDRQRGQWSVANENRGPTAVEFRTDDAQLLGLWTAIRMLGVIRQVEDRGDRAELLTRAEILLTAFMVGLEPALPSQASLVPLRVGGDQTA